MRALIEQHRVIVCTGSGGVGKTTTSAALGVAGAMLGRRVLVLTIDPARRLWTALGMAQGNDDVRVPGQRYPGELWAGTIDPPRIFAGYVLQHSPDRATADRLMANALYRQLSTTLSGSQEFTSLSRLHEAATNGRYDLVILDTPPAAHAADFLLAPARLGAVFESSMVSLFMGRTRGLGLAAAAWKQGMKLFLGALTSLTGSAFVGTMRDFFSAIDAIAPAIRETTHAAEQLLLDERTGYVLISNFDAAKIQEGREFSETLATTGHHLRQVVVNRAWPDWTPADAAQRTRVRQSLQAAGEPALARLYEQLASHYLARRELQPWFTEQVTVPEMDEVVGLPALERMARVLVPELGPA